MESQSFEKKELGKKSSVLGEESVSRKETETVKKLFQETPKRSVLRQQFWPMRASWHPKKIQEEGFAWAFFVPLQNLKKCRGWKGFDEEEYEHHKNVATDGGYLVSKCSKDNGFRRTDARECAKYGLQGYEYKTFISKTKYRIWGRRRHPGEDKKYFWSQEIIDQAGQKTIYIFEALTAHKCGKK